MNEYLWTYYTKDDTCWNELKQKDLKSKGQTKAGYSFIELFGIDQGIITSEYSSDNEIIQSLIKTNAEELLSD